MKLVFSILLFLFFLSQITTLTGCANIIPPGGGPKDSIPPRLVKAIPKDSSKNFSANKIELQFNEFIELQNISQEIIMSPTTKTTPQVERKLNVVTVKFRDTLDANTTYSINFGNGIKDLNEGNRASEFTYIFSTGNQIDAYTLQGKVIMAETGKADSTLIVALYKDLDDSAVSKQKPRYYTKLNGRGEFTFKNLPDGKFNLFALKDENGNKLYDLKNEFFAFIGEPLNITVSNSPVVLYAFTESKEGSGSPIDRALENRKNSRPVTVEKLKLLNSSLDGGKQDLLKNLELVFNNPIKKIDSGKVILTDEKFIPLKKYAVSLDTSFKKVIVKTSFTENTTYKLILEKDFAVDTSGNSYTRSDTIPFYTAREVEYGSFKINFKNTNKYKNPVLQVIAEDAVVAAYSIKSPQLTVKLFYPSIYELRVLEDENNNGIWDTGNYRKKKQPEKVTLLNTKLTIKPAWDTEINISL